MGPRPTKSDPRRHGDLPLIGAGRDTRPGVKTRDAILDIAEEMLRSRSFSAFSYQDIADRVGIRKASIHYHFPTKEELGIALVRRFAEEAKIWAQELDDRQASARERLDAYYASTAMIAKDDKKICIYGALGAELLALPDGVARAYRVFLQAHHRWLAETFETGQHEGSIHQSATPEAQATFVASTLQGALQIVRSSADTDSYFEVVDLLRSSLEVPGT